MAPERPNPYQWIRYAFGGRLPDRYRDWVLHDATSRTWLLRHAARLVVQALPIIVVLFVVFGLLPGELWVVSVGLGIGLLVGLAFGLTVAPESVEARLVKHGYPADFGKDIRAASRRRGR
jgi:hypothetical protein